MLKFMFIPTKKSSNTDDLQPPIKSVYLDSNHLSRLTSELPNVAIYYKLQKARKTDYSNEQVCSD